MKSLLFALMLASALLANDKFTINVPVAIQIGHTALELNHEHSSIESTMLFVGISPTIVSNFISCSVGLDVFIAAYDNNKAFSEQTQFNFATSGLVINLQFGVKIAKNLHLYVQPELLWQAEYGESDFNGRVNPVSFAYQVGFKLHNRHDFYVGRSDTKLIDYKGRVNGTIFAGYRYIFIC